MEKTQSMTYTRVCLTIRPALETRELMQTIFPIPISEPCSPLIETKVFLLFAVTPIRY